MWVIIAFFLLHWYASAFSQSFFLHRYGSHGQFDMNRFWHRFFYLFTWVTQGSSYLVPRAYALMHREHHAHSDTEKDPHSPHFFNDVFSMMWHTKNVYEDMLHGRRQYPRRFAQRLPEWPTLDFIGNLWVTRLFFGFLYFLVYFHFAPSPWFYLMLPVHFMIGPIHGAFVNWCGHKYGYRNYDLDDHSHNTFRWDFFFMGEAFQNNHHKYPGRANFATKRSEFDLTYPAIALLQKLRILKLKPHATGYGD